MRHPFCRIAQSIPEGHAANRCMHCAPNPASDKAISTTATDTLVITAGSRGAGRAGRVGEDE
eukprot:2924015-Pyramimonas_sp.AAC.1